MASRESKKTSGILAPLFSVYSKNSIGIGDLSDLKKLIDWAALTGNSIVQLLPMNEAGSLFCPYDSISSFALEPVYLSLRELAAKNKCILDKIKILQKKFPTGKTYVNYKVKAVKLEILREIYFWQSDTTSVDFDEFCEENKYWLRDFSLYRALKDFQGGKAWYEWSDEFKNRESQVLKKFADTHADEIKFQEWMQWHLFKQFKEVKAYAKEKKVSLKGDLPILVSRDSADVWQHPEFFKLEFAAGAPPDMYCAKGQRWGMPTYNWGRIAQDGYLYLKEKLKYAENFYDILRIDHAVGLFRIWSIPYNDPLENQGLNGSFDPADEKLWDNHGRTLLQVMQKSTNISLCAEDLGVIPYCCTKALEDLGIPGNDVERWVKDWNNRHDFLAPQEYRQLSVAMLSTHDTTNWPAWWENEAGTVDEDLFLRKCSDHRKINFSEVKEKLFDSSRSCHGRLLWKDEIDSVDKLVQGLSPQGTVPKEHLSDFIDLYLNTYQEKEKLWKQLGLRGKMREGSDAEIVKAALKITLSARSILCINTIFDWLYLADLLKGDAYKYRINTPGTISDKNWSLTLPISLEELLKHKVNKEIRKMIGEAGRV